MTEKSTLSRRSLLRNAGAAGAGIAAIAAVPAVGDLATATTSTADDVVSGGLEDLRLVKVFADTSEQHLLSGFDDTHVVHPDGGIEFLLWSPAELAALEATGLRFELLETPMERHVTNTLALRKRNATRAALRAPGETANGEYRTLAEHNADMAALAEQYPTKCKLVELPHRTLERRVVLGVEICDDVDRYDGRPVFYNDGCHHAREFPAAEVPIMWAYDLLEADTLDDTDPNKARLLTIRANVRNIVVPVVNADGFNWAREALVDHPNGTLTIGLNIAGRQGYWRKNRRAYLTGTTPTPIGVVSFDDPNDYDAYGIDPNRNYGFGWGGDGSSRNPESLTFRGESPFSEQEPQNVQFVFERFQCLGSISHHTSGDLILWAWGDTFDNAPDNDLLEGMGRAMAEYNGYTPQKSIDLYVTTGTASDYMYGSRASISYTFEHAGSSFHPEYLDTVPAMYDRNRQALMFLAEQTCLVPALRPNYDDEAVLSPEAKQRMADLGVPLGQLNHGIIRGSLGTAGEVRLLKRYETQLWVQDYENGNTGAANPLRQPSIDEFTDCSFRTAEDGSFELHVNPSTQPKVEFLGREEQYDLVFIADDGRSAGRRMVVKRGEVIDLGTIPLA